MGPFPALSAGSGRAFWVTWKARSFLGDLKSLTTPKADTLSKELAPPSRAPFLTWAAGELAVLWSHCTEEDMVSHSINGSSSVGTYRVPCPALRPDLEGGGRGMKCKEGGRRGRGGGGQVENKRMQTSAVQCSARKPQGFQQLLAPIPVLPPPTGPPRRFD